MGLIYANANCVLSTRASKGSNGGLFRLRDPLPFDYLVRERGARQLAVRWNERLLDVFKEKVLFAPVSQRRWIFQEQCLAQRTLHFTSGSVLFDCNQLIASDHASHQDAQQHSLRPVIRLDGQLHRQADCDFVTERIFPTYLRHVVELSTGRKCLGRSQIPATRSSGIRLRNCSIHMPIKAYEGNSISFGDSQAEVQKN